MTSSSEFKTVVLEDGEHAVVRTDPARPRTMEVIAIFYDAARANNYAAREGSQSPTEAPQRAHKTPPRQIAAENETELTERQRALLSTLRANSDDNHLVEMRSAALAKAAGIPLGSLHSVLQTLEKKQRIGTKRTGSASAPAVYQVL